MRFKSGFDVFVSFLIAKYLHTYEYETFLCKTHRTATKLFAFVGTIKSTQADKRDEKFLHICDFILFFRVVSLSECEQ